MKRTGRRNSLTQTQNKEARVQYISGVSVDRIIASLGISQATFYRYKSGWNLSVLNIAIESTEGRFSKQYHHGNHRLTNIEKFELHLARKLALNLGYEIKLWPCSFSDIVQANLSDEVDIAMLLKRRRKRHRRKILSKEKRT